MPPYMPPSGFWYVIYYKVIPAETEDRTIEGYCSLKDFEEILLNILPGNIDKTFHDLR